MPDPTPDPTRRPGRCTVWTAPLTAAPPQHLAWLDDGERARAASFLRPADAERFVLGAALLRAAVAARSGVRPGRVRVDRTCDRCGRQHGRPTVPGTDLDVSVAHSGGLVAVAVRDAGPVGVDVEEIGSADAVDPVTHRALTRLAAPPGAAPPSGRPADVLARWCRTEALLKATGDGLRVPPADVVLPPLDAAPTPVPYRDGTLLVAVRDLPLGPDHVGAVAALGPAPLDVEVLAGVPLLAAPAERA